MGQATSLGIQEESHMAREAGGYVNDCRLVVGDGAREMCVENGNGVGVNDGVQTNFASIVLAKGGDTGATVGEGE